MMKKIMLTVGLGVLFLGQQIALGVDLDFIDKDEISDWALPSVESLVDLGIINGNSEGQFMPEKSVNRAEFCKILVLATGVPIYNAIEQSFLDVEAEDWFFNYIETAKNQGWVAGYPDGLFRPAGNINRAEVSKILVKAFDIKAPELQTDQKWYERYVRALEADKLLPYAINFGNFNGSHFPSRMEIVEQIYRLMMYGGKISSFEEFLEEEPEDTNLVYTPEVISPLESKIHPDAGEFYINVKKGINQKIYVYKAEKDVDVLRLLLNAKNNNVKVSEFQFRRIGSGKFSDFSKAWLELDGTVVSNKVLILDDLVRIRLNQEFTIPRNKTKELVLKIDLSGQGKKGTSSRFVLYIPEWIASNTAKKIGFFPFGGEDLEIKN